MLGSLSIACCVILVVPNLTEKCFSFCFGFDTNWY